MNLHASSALILHAVSLLIISKLPEIVEGVPAVCQPPMAYPYYGDVTCTNDNNEGSSCSFMCDEGYRLSAEVSVLCEKPETGSVGNWTGNAPTCVEKGKCLPSIVSLDNGTVSCLDANYGNSTCIFNCSDDFMLFGESIVQCIVPESNTTGEWNDTLPYCLIAAADDTKSCVPFPKPANGKFSCSDNGNLGSVCTYTCDPDYAMFGAKEIVCEIRPDKRAGWSEIYPLCAIPLGECPSEMTAPMNGRVKCSGGLYVSSRCTFTCDSGFTMVGKEVSSCVDANSDKIGDWTSLPPTCESDISCLPELTTVNNGNVVCTNGNQDESKCTFSCHEGFSLSGVGVLGCGDNNGDLVGEWDNTPPLCQEIPIVCQPPMAQPYHGDSICTDKNNEGSSCSFTCNEGFWLSTKIVINCEKPETGSVGKWSGFPPTCTEIKCEPAVTAPENGAVTCTNENEKGSSCTFTCDVGFKLSSVGAVTCEKSSTLGLGKWSALAPTCNALPVNCKEIIPGNSVTMECSNGSQEDSECTFQCDGEAVLIGKDKTKCLKVGKDEGKWDAEVPECKTSCDMKTIEVKRATAKCTSLNKIGSICSFECLPGFALDFKKPIICTEQGTWNSSSPECKTLPCTPPLKTLLGKAVNCSNGNQPGSSCKANCPKKSPPEDKLNLVCGDPEIRGGAGFWSKNLMSCTGCGKGILDVMLLIDSSSNLAVWDFAELRDWAALLVSEQLGEVITGGIMFIGISVFGSKEDVCDPDNTVPEFKVISKLEQQIPAKLKAGIQSLNPVRGCSHFGNAIMKSVSHLASRKRAHSTPVLVAIVAGPSADVYSTAVNAANSSDIKIMVVAAANASLLNVEEITGSKKTILYVPAVKHFGSVTRSFMTIIMRMDCPDYSLCSGPIDNGEATCNIAVGDVPPGSEECRIRCKPDFQLVGNSTALCGDVNGDTIPEWISPKATCKKISCPPLSAPENGFISCSRKTKFGSACKFWCQPDLFLIGNADAFCGDHNNDGEGEWNSLPPKCTEELFCMPELSAPQYGILQCTEKNAFGSVCTFACAEGYNIKGSGIVQCDDPQKNGDVQWSGVPPFCEVCESESCLKDVILVVDGSGSILKDEFMKAKKWVVEVLDGFKGEIDSGGTRVGVIQFSGEATFMCGTGSVKPKFTIELELGQYTFREVKDIVLEIGHLRGCTLIGDAIEHATQHFDALGRPGVEKILLLVTDGQSNDKVENPSKEAREKNVRIIAVGIGKFDAIELQLIAGAENVIDVDGFSELGSVTDLVQKKITSGSGSNGHGPSSACSMKPSVLFIVFVAVHLPLLL